MYTSTGWLFSRKPPMQQNMRIAGKRTRYGIDRSFTQIPTSGRLRITSMRLPIHIDTTRPQKRPGFCVITCGPGTMPCSIIAPSMRAIIAPVGMPRVSIGMK
ncbi:hypothetical protein D3C83_26500 [compost metagenome]